MLFCDFDYEVGYGDLLAVTLIGRITSVFFDDLWAHILAVYQLLLLIIIPI